MLKTNKTFTNKIFVKKKNKYSYIKGQPFNLYL